MRKDLSCEYNIFAFSIFSLVNVQQFVSVDITNIFLQISLVCFILNVLPCLMYIS